jgi:uncharacterized protein
MMMRAMMMAGVVLAGCSQPPLESPQALPEQQVTLKGVELTVQIAESEDERQKGLMFVKSMPENDGMLFVWDEAAPRSFWMRNTYIPLDIVYLNEGKVVSVVQGKPLDETGLPSGVPADMVLEVNAGWVAKHGVTVGDTLEIQ